MDEFIRLFLAALACFRLAELVTVDDGPFDMFLRMRVVAGVYDMDENGRQKSSLGRLFACPYCVGIWVALGLALWLHPAEWALWWIALAGGQALLQSVGGRR